MEFVFGDHRLDVDRRELWRGAELIAVEPQVLDLLVYLLQNRDRVVSKNDLLDAVWGGRTVSESTLTSRINAVRKAVGDNGRAQQLIRTVPRKGVRFVGIVCEHPKPAAPINARPIVGIDPPNPALALADQRPIDAKIGLAWLTRLALEQYERAFRDNDVDAGVLPELTAEDLIGLGVTSIGHRRILLAAIATLRDKPTRASERNAPITALASKEVPSRSPSSSAERRQLTVMFCDLVGSTELAARLDPEDLLEVISAYHRAVTEIVSGFDGFVAKYMGDGVPVYFGYPRAHEDDAERAVRAGLGLIDAVSRLDVKSTKLQTRVGIATGLVVVGDLIGSGSAQEPSVVGDTPNLAARLQGLAEPDAVVITAGTRRLVGDLFEYRDLGAVEVKGIAAPVPAWQVLRSSAIESRFEALRGSVLSRLVGRDDEIDLLLRRWARAKAGDGQVVLVSRIRHRQVAHSRSIGGAAPHRAASPTALFLLALSPG